MHMLPTMAAVLALAITIPAAALQGRQVGLAKGVNVTTNAEQAAAKKAIKDKADQEAAAKVKADKEAGEKAATKHPSSPTG